MLFEDLPSKWLEVSRAKSLAASLGIKDNFFI